MKYALTNMSLLDGHADMVPVAGKAILVDEERIAAIVPEAEIPADYEIVDLWPAEFKKGEMVMFPNWSER